MPIYSKFIVDLRAGLRVCPERNERRLKEAHFTARAQCFDFGTSLGFYVLCHVFGNMSEK